MRFLLQISMPHEPFNSYVKDGSAGGRIGRVLEETKPESVYFTEQDGKRCAVAVYNMDKNSDIPALSEPWFLSFNADIRFNVAMTPEDLRNSGLDDVGKKWS